MLLGVSGSWEDSEVTSLPEDVPKEPDSEKETWGSSGGEGQAPSPRSPPIAPVPGGPGLPSPRYPTERPGAALTSCWKAAGCSRSLCRANSLSAFQGGW